MDIYANAEIRTGVFFHLEKRENREQLRRGLDSVVKDMHYIIIFTKLPKSFFFPPSRPWRADLRASFFFFPYDTLDSRCAEREPKTRKRNGEGGIGLNFCCNAARGSAFLAAAERGGTRGAWGRPARKM